jgi:hypothetical protein
VVPTLGYAVLALPLVFALQAGVVLIVRYGWLDIAVLVSLGLTILVLTAAYALMGAKVVDGKHGD